MSKFESISLKGDLEVTLYDEHMQVKDTRVLHNIVVDTGKYLLASVFLGDGEFNSLNMMKVGSGADVATVAQTKLVSVLPCGKDDGVSLTKSGDCYGTRVDNVVTYEATFNPGEGTGAISEAGMFSRKVVDGLKTDTMFNRTVFSVVNKAQGDTLTIKWSITIN